MWPAKLSRFFESKLFFGIIIGFFTLSSLWLALGSTFPMAFDEEVHYGITSLYAENINPFAIHQTQAANKFGSVATDPSYLYYYLLSFPYRLLAAINTSQTFIVTGLRLINIALCVGALFLYRRLLISIGLSTKLVQLVIATVTLIPIMPLLAAQINYDNLMLLLTPLLLMSALSVRIGLRDGVLRPLPAAASVALIFYGSIVKYAFLPIAAATGIYLLILLVLASRTHKDLWANSLQSAAKLRLATKVGLVILVGIGILMFSQRIVRNYIHYQAVVPDCATVLTVNDCKQWGPWGRDYILEHAKSDDQVLRNPVYYTATHWAYGMWNRLFFTLAGPGNDYATRKRFPVPSYTFIVLGAIGTISFAVYGRRLIRRYPAFVLFGLTGGLYIGALLAQEYANYVQTGQPVAINGRYLLPFLPLVGVMMASGVLLAVRKLRATTLLPAMSAVVILLFLQGGGVLAYIVRSDSTWLYNNHVVQQTDHVLKTVIDPLIIFKGQ